MSDFRFQPWPGTIAITTLLEFCSWLLVKIGIEVKRWGRKGFRIENGAKKKK